MKLFFLLIAFFSLHSSFCGAADALDFSGFQTKKNLPDMEILAEIQKGRLILSGNVRNGAYIYSFLGKQKEPIPTTIFIAGQKIPQRQIQESKASSVFDEAYLTKLYIHQKAFQVTVNVTEERQKNIKEGYLLYQICDSLICSLPKKIPFQIQ